MAEKRLNPNWTGWQRLQGTFTHDPALISLGLGHLHVFGRSAQSTLIHEFQREGVWDRARFHRGIWEDLGGAHPDAPGGLATGPAVTTRGRNIHVFATTPGTRVLHRWWDGFAWQSWQNLGGDLASAPAACSWGIEHVSLFARGLFNNLIHTYWNGSVWRQPWEDLGDGLSILFAPAAVSWAPGRIDVFAVSAVDQSLAHRWYDGVSWSDWENLGGVLTSSPAVTARGFGMLDVFGRGSNGNIYWRAYNGKSWQPWIELTGMAVDSAPAAAASSPERIDIVARGNDGQLYLRTWA